MSVSIYQNTTCKYRLDKLDKVVYLIDESSVKNIHIDGGEAYISGVSLVTKQLNVYSISLQDSDELDERYKFTHTLSFSMEGYASLDDFDRRYYVIVKTLDGVYWLVNPMMPCKVSYTYTLDNQGSRTEFELSTISNYPTLRVTNVGIFRWIPTDDDMCVDGEPSVNVYECSYKYCTFNKLKLNETPYSFHMASGVTYSNDGFKDIVFNKNSASFQEIYDGNSVQHKLTFNIRFDDYKSSWHYNLLEFVDNKYACIVYSSCGRALLCGFNFGLQPKYTVNASNDFGMTNIQIEMSDLHDTGTFISHFDDVTIEKNDAIIWEYTKEHDAYECVSHLTAKYLLKKELDAFHNPTGRYMVLSGYASRFPNLNLIGTFSEIVTFTSYECQMDCRLETNIPSLISFNAANCKTYTVSASSDWSVTSTSNHITVSPSSGVANVSYNVSVCNSQIPTTNVVTSYLNFEYCNGWKSNSYTVIVYKDTCWQSGQFYRVDAKAQYLTIPKSCCFTSGSSTSDAISQINIQSTYVSFRISANPSTNSRTITVDFTTCEGAVSQVTIEQTRCYENWEREGSICDGNNLCDIERRYTGTSYSTITARTDDTRLVNCTQSDVCVSDIMYQWREISATTDPNTYWCDECQEEDVKYEWREISATTDPNTYWCDECGGIEPQYEWRDITPTEDKTTYWCENCESPSPAPPTPPTPIIVEYRETSGYPYCQGYDKWVNVYTEKSIDGGNTWTVEDSNEVLVERNSTDCGYNPEERHRTVSGTPYCQGYDKMVTVTSEVSYDGGYTWIVTASTETLVEHNSTDCGYVPQPTQYRWVRTDDTICVEDPPEYRWVRTDDTICIENN